MTTRKHPHDAGAGEHAQHPVEHPKHTGETAAGPVETRVGELESQLAEARDRQLRLAADFDNYKKRTRQEQVETIQHASAELIGRLLPVLDDLQKALENRPRNVDESWARGLELGVRKLEEPLATHGLEPIEAVGERFDPKLHEAVGHEESADQPEDTVVSELRRGYRIRDRVVRPALVRVARRPELPASENDQDL